MKENESEWPINLAQINQIMKEDDTLTCCLLWAITADANGSDSMTLGLPGEKADLVRLVASLSLEQKSTLAIFMRTEGGLPQRLAKAFPEGPRQDLLEEKDRLKIMV